MFSSEKLHLVPTTDLALLRIYYQLFQRIFSEPENQIDFADFIETQATQSTVQVQSFIAFHEDEPIGIREVKYDLRSGYAYVPYGGVVENYRGKHIYPWMVEQTEKFLREKNIHTVLIDCEKPDTAVAVKRLQFFVRLGYFFVDAPYIRPNPVVNSESDLQAENDHYVLGMKLLNELKPSEEISRDLVAQAYTQLLHLDNFLAVNELQKLPSVKKFQGWLNTQDKTIPIFSNTVLEKLLYK